MFSRPMIIIMNHRVTRLDEITSKAAWQLQFERVMYLYLVTQLLVGAHVYTYST